jgi:hypothetical protein
LSFSKVAAVITLFAQRFFAPSRKTKLVVISTVVALFGMLISAAPASAATLVPVNIPGPSFIANGMRGQGFVAFNNKTYFCGTDEASGFSALFSYSGFGAADMPLIGPSGNPVFEQDWCTGFSGVVFDNKLFLTIATFDAQSNLTVRLASVDASETVHVFDSVNSPSEVSDLYVWNGSLYFHGYRDGDNSYLVKLDAGSSTPIWLDTQTGAPTDPSSLMAMNGKLYFSAHSSASSFNYQLYSWDGSAFARDATGGTPPNWGGLQTKPKYLTAFNNHLYFFGWDSGPSDFALFGFNGTTFEKFTSPFVAYAPANPMTVLGNNLYLSDGTELLQGAASSSGLSLAFTSLTPGTTNNMRAPVAFGASIYAPVEWLAPNSPVYGVAGFSAGTSTDYWTGGIPQRANYLGVGNGALFFTAQNAAGDTGLWALAMTASAPSGLTVTNGNGQVSVAFTPGDQGGMTITNYEYSIDGGASWVAVSPAATAGPISISGLTNGQTYSIKLRAITDAGNGDASASVTGAPSNGQPSPTQSPTPTSSDSSMNSSSTLPHTGMKNPVLAGGAMVLVIIFAAVAMALRPRRKTETDS